MASPGSITTMPANRVRIMAAALFCAAVLVPIAPAEARCRSHPGWTCPPIPDIPALRIKPPLPDLPGGGGKGGLGKTLNP